jgi:hypothetical protein
VSVLSRVTALPLLFFVAVTARFAGLRRSDRGDVPGWVLITLMTAGIVTVLWAFAGPRLLDILSNALDSVSGPGGSS